MKKIAALSLAGMFLAPAVSNATDLQQCMLDASKRYGVHPYLLWSVARTESKFNPRAINVNRDGTYDIGFMQINSWWLERRKTQHDSLRLGDYGVTKEMLFDPCTNIHAGAWILANNMQRHGNTWKAVGAYNAVTPANQAAYIRKVQKNLRLALNESRNTK